MASKIPRTRVAIDPIAGHSAARKRHLFAAAIWAISMGSLWCLEAKVGSHAMYSFGDGSKPWYLVNPKIAGKWMFIPLKMVCIGIDP